MAETGSEGFYVGRPEMPPSLTESERAQIDHSLRLTLRALHALLASLPPPPPPPKQSKLARWMGLQEGAGKEEGGERRAHELAVRQILQARLRGVVQAAGEMQMEWVEREARRKALVLPPAASSSSTIQPSTSSSVGLVRPIVRAVSVKPRKTAQEDAEEEEEEEDDALGGMLTQEQMQVFEEENQALLASYTSDLNQLKSTQSALLSISEMQDQLLGMLGAQAEQVERIAEDAMESVADFAGGNEQLRKARDGQRSGRLWILLLLWGATFTLLFLHLYN